jgi:hypothetical protein
VADTPTLSHHPSRFHEKFWKVSWWELNWAADIVRLMVAKSNLSTATRLAMSAIDICLYTRQDAVITVEAEVDVIFHSLDHAICGFLEMVR